MYIYDIMNRSRARGRTRGSQSWLLPEPPSRSMQAASVRHCARIEL